MNSYVSLPLHLAVGALLLGAGLAAPAPAHARQEPDLEGVWKGDLQAGGVALRIVFNISRIDGVWTATMDSPDQGATGIPVASVIVDGQVVTFKIPAVQGGYTGTLRADGQQIEGQWSQGGQSIPLALLRDAAEPASGGRTDLWQGTLDVPGASLRIVFHLTTAADGSRSATMDSPDQGVSGITVGDVSMEEGRLRLTVPAIGGRYEGTMQDDEHIEGTWSQSGQSWPLNLERVEAVPVLERPQEPEPPYPYDAEDVRFENPDAGIELAGTLTVPAGQGPFPAVVLISGSGPQDRDEALFGHRPFLVLADHLTRQGIAVLRYDERGVGESTGDFSTATSRDFASDVLAGVAFLKERAAVNSAQIGLVGHSEGGLIAPMVAADHTEIAFIVLMAGPGLPGKDILYLQSALIMRANGSSEASIERNRAVQEQLFGTLKLRANEQVIRTRLRSILADAIAAMTDEEKAQAGVTEATLDATIDAQVEQLSSPWFRFFVTYDPAPALARVQCPVLAINGEKDLQVPPAENLSAIAAALARGGNTAVHMHELPHLNHLFQTADTGSPTEYARIEETFAPSALELISGWILEQVARGN